jgi:hypothetical protein
MTSSPSPTWDKPPVAASAPTPAVVWLVPIAAVLAVIGVVTPWFDPSGTYKGKTVLHAADKLYSWKDGKIGLVAPILLVALAVSVVGLVRGRTNTRFHRSADPVHAAAKGVLIAGAVSLVCVTIAWFLVPQQFNNVPSDAGGSWDGAEKLGIDMTRGPQLGYWLTAAAAILTILAGIALFLVKQPSAPAGFATPGGGSAFPAPGPAPSGYAPPSGPPLAGPSGYPPPPGPNG